ncbi:RiPP maturation radical SAM C-methyltransferase [Actinocrinis puniceicyclus]|uniref:RiPP maturation radical SAM C-methyltransferase n=1 Tax=Actinocrinis puniceicyclus TaxID=977794 RepID=A0A8J7WP05_9ACTN|nr:RiPP maturation radical SAM C-methyltransferase [Actinocrinis puniceicyclus]MBS2965971.1 RiPP maturation radical SAM C-methyltransferase [Actinocrinis puniceicyclus]
MRELMLVNMPFADRRRPSFALSQLSALVGREFPGQFEVRIRYLNHDFVRFFGPADYDAIAGDNEFHIAGLGDWMFRQIAFPGLPDNAEEYLARYFPGPDRAPLRRRILSRRESLRDFMDSLADKYRLAEADLLGFSSMFTQNVPSLAMAQLAKERDPGIITLMGGANCEAPMGAVLAEHAPQADFVFSGPALVTLPQFLRAFLDGDLERAHEIPGVVTRRNCHERRYRKAIGAGRDIDDYFDPDYSAFKESFDRMNASARTARVEPELFFETSRGCWWGERAHCTFCGLNGQTMAYRAMSPENALRQFEWLFDHAPWATKYCCTDNIMPMDYLTEVFPKLDPPQGASVFYEVKVGLDQQDMAVMSQAGVTVVQPGIEALATATLKLMRKGTSAFQNLQFLKNTVGLEISPVWNLLIGFPGEAESTYAKYLRDLPLLVHLPPPQGCYPVRFDRYSPYFNNAAEYGLELEPVDYYRLTYPFGPAALRELAYYFADQKASAYAVSAATWLRPLGEALARWRERWQDGAERPVLRLERDGENWTVADSRSGQLRRHVLDRDDARLLLHLDRPVRIDNLPRELPDHPDVSGSLERLRAEGLVFVEGERAMNLALADTAVDPMPRPRRTVVGGSKLLSIAPARPAGVPEPVRG